MFVPHCWTVYNITVRFSHNRLGTFWHGSVFYTSRSWQFERYKYVSSSGNPSGQYSLYNCHILCQGSINCLLQINKRNEGNVLFNDALSTFYLRLYCVRHMVKDHSHSERGNPLLPHGLLFPINSNGSFICTILQTG